jgi:hypothetical protein
MLRKLLLTCGVGLIASLFAYADTTETGEWSEVVNGVQGRLAISEDRPFNGTGMFAVYLELKNSSDVLKEIYFEPTRTVQCQLLDANEKPLSTAGSVTSILVPRPFWLTLPSDSSLRFRLSVGGYMIPRNEGAFIPMLCGDWLIKSGDLDDYKLKVKFTVNPPKVNSAHRPWKGTLNVPSVKVPAMTTPNNALQRTRR